MIRQSDIICFALSRWDAPISSPALSLAKEFAKNNRVFYVEHPYSWKDYYRLKKNHEIEIRRPALLSGKNIYTNPPEFSSNLTIVTTPLTWPINFLPPGWLYQKFSSINDRIVANTIRRVIRDFDVKDFIYINFFDPYFLRKLPSDIKPLVSVYQSMDDITQVEYSNRHGARLEEEIVRNFDITLCTSRELTRLKSQFSPRVFLHPNAVDIDIFRRAASEVLPKPAEMNRIRNRIIGYTGSIEYRTDFELLKKLADCHHDKTLFLVGPVQGDEHVKHGLDRLPNVIFAGPRKIVELPAYLKHFDCVIIPFKKNKLTKSIYPLKINEYLAAGKPVIATKFSDDIASFGNVAYVEDSDDGFIAAIDRALEEDSQERSQERIRVAEQNTWKARVEQFWRILEKEFPTA